MENPYLRNNAYYKELKQKVNLIKVEKPIIDKYISDYKLSIQSTPEAQISNNLIISSNKNQIRTMLRDELSKILTNSQEVSYVLDSLDKSFDLINFYKFGKLFLKSIEGIRGLDANYFIQLWNHFKNKLLSEKELKEINKLEKEKEKEKEKLLALTQYGSTTTGRAKKKPGRKPKN